MSLRWNQRGVAYWRDGDEARVFWGTGDGYLVAVDARTGRPVAGVRRSAARVDLMEGLPRAVRGARDYLNALTYSVQSPPIVVGDVVITPASISSLVIKKEQIPGWVRGHDVRTGQLLWTFHTVPQPGEAGHDTWKDDSWRDAGKVTVWTAMSADPDAGLRLPADQHRRARLLRRPSARRQPLRREPGVPRRRRPAGACGASRRCTTACGTTTTRRRRTCSTSPSTAAA